MVTVNPLACSSIPREAEMIPFPREEVTPPVTKIYLALEVINRLKNTGAKVDYLVSGGTPPLKLFHF